MSDYLMVPRKLLERVFAAFESEHENPDWALDELKTCLNPALTRHAQTVRMPPSPYMPDVDPSSLSDYERGEAQGRCDMWAMVKELNSTAIWLPMDTAPKDGTLLRLLVDFTDRAIDDAEGLMPTIGCNQFKNTGVDEWQFVGWCWSHDHFTDGEGTPVGWMPMLDTPSNGDGQYD